MSTNDDSASRRSRRADQGDRRVPGRQERDERWDQSSRDRAPAESYQDQRARDSQFQRGAYSNFSRHAYAPDPAPQQPQGYYPETGQRNEPPRFSEPSLPVYTPPPAPYEPEPPQLNYRDPGRDDLFVREPLPPAFDTNPYGAQAAGYQGDPYDQSRSQPPQKPATPRREEPQFSPRDVPTPPLDDYGDSFSGRGAQETQASRFYLPEDEPQRQRASQPDRGYAAPPPTAPQYAAPSYPPQDDYGAEYHDSWDDEHALNDDRGDPHLPAAHGNELDEDFFADEDEFDHDPLPEPKRGRKKLIAAALAGAIMVGSSGAYLYKVGQRRRRRRKRNALYPCGQPAFEGSSGQSGWQAIPQRRKDHLRQTHAGWSAGSSRFVCASGPCPGPCFSSARGRQLP